MKEIKKIYTNTGRQVVKKYVEKKNLIFFIFKILWVSMLVLLFKHEFLNSNIFKFKLPVWRLTIYFIYFFFLSTNYITQTHTKIVSLI